MTRKKSESLEILSVDKSKGKTYCCVKGIANLPIKLTLFAVIININLHDSMTNNKSKVFTLCTNYIFRIRRESWA